MFKKISTYSLFFSLLFVFNVNAQNDEEEIIEVQKLKKIELPIITQAINNDLFDGESEKIKKIIQERKLFIDQLLEQLQTQDKNLKIQVENIRKQLEKDESGIIIENINNSDSNKTIEELIQSKEKITEILDSFKDIHYKNVNLIHEIENKDENINKRIEIRKPYSINTVLKLNDFIQELFHQEKLVGKQVEQTAKRLSKLNDILEDTVVEYTILLGKEETNIEVYSLLRNIYLYQTDYAILSIKNNKNKKTLSHVKKQISENTKMLPNTLVNIQIDDNDFSALKTQLGEMNSTFDKLRSEHNTINNKLGKTSLKAELELDNLELKIKNAKSELEAEVHQIEKQINLNKIQYSYFIKNLLSQKEQAIEIERNGVEFNSSWLKVFWERKKAPKEFKKMVNLFQKNQNEVDTQIFENAQMLDSLNRSTLEFSGLQQQLSVNKDPKNKKLSKLKSNLNKQIDKNLKTIQRLSLQLTENNENILKNKEKHTRIIKILSQQLNKIEQIGKWFGDKFNNQLDKVKNILYYPITNFGERPFTLAIILKVLLYLILGFATLRFLRPRFTRFLTSRTKLDEGAAHSISTLFYYFGGLLVLLIALSASGFNLGQMMIVFGALGVGIGFGLQNIANNFVSGMILLIDRTLTVGDSITLSDGTHGKVSKLAMRYTVIRTNGGNDIIVPNSELIANRVTSMTFDDNYFRIEIPFGVSYDADPEQVKEITLEVANKVKHTINRESQKSAVLFSGLGDNSLDFVLRVWVFIYDRYRPYAIRSDYYFKLFKAFKEAGIEIPYPQRDFHIKSIDKNLINSLKNQQKN